MITLTKTGDYMARYLWLQTFSKRGQNNQELFQTEYDCFKRDIEKFQKHKITQLELI